MPNGEKIVGDWAGNKPIGKFIVYDSKGRVKTTFDSSNIKTNKEN